MNSQSTTSTQSLVRLAFLIKLDYNDRLILGTVIGIYASSVFLKGVTMYCLVQEASQVSTILRLPPCALTYKSSGSQPFMVCAPPLETLEH